MESWLNPVNSALSWLVSIECLVRRYIELTVISSQDPISVTSLNLGNSYPLLSNARIRPADGQGGIVSRCRDDSRERNSLSSHSPQPQRLEVDIDYSDSLHLSLATSLLVNFPLPKFAVLPVALGVELVGVGGTVSVNRDEVTK